jgi:hypothetical protein
MGQTPTAATGGCPTDFERAEMRREVAQLCVV